MRTAAVFLIASALGACVAEGPEIEPAFGPAVGGQEDQGTSVLGGLEAYALTGDRYAVSGATATRNGVAVTVTAAGGALHATRNGNQYGGDSPELIGIRFTAADGSQLEVTAVYPASNDDPIRYDLKRRASSTAGWEAPCGTEPAVALSGHYTRDRDHTWVEGDITFACQSGVAYKCIRWGYVDPGDPTDYMWDVNRACTRLANANYCFRDESWTREGTSVSFFDKYGLRADFPQDPPYWDPWILPPSLWAPPTNEYFIEAAWKADSVLCLSKTRWASMPLDPCGPGLVLPDPRTTTGAKYCEQYAQEGLLNDPDILIINTSKYNDLAFDEWQTAAGDRLTTIMGQHDRGGATDVPPFPGMTYVRSNGVLLRVPTTVMLEAGVPFVPVFQYCTSWTSTTHKCVVSTTPPTAAYVTKPGSTEAEGHLIGVGGPGRQALYLYKSGTDYVTATSKPSSSYTKIGKTPLGYVLAIAP